MDQNQDTYFIGLVDRYMNNTCSRAELDEVLMLAEKDPMKLYSALKEQWMKAQRLAEDGGLQAGTVLAQAKLIEAQLLKPTQSVTAATTRSRFARVGLSIAAATLVAVGLAAYFFAGKPVKSPPFPQQAGVVAPVSNKATVTLANGRTIALDSLLAGTAMVQEDGKLIKNEKGQLVYQALTLSSDHRPVYNTLHNPRGSKVVDVFLADGTHIWLNAGSSITFPVAFTESERRISLDGEAYLEVSHNAQKPFIVQTGPLVIEVLGTGFNVNAYRNRTPIEVTLLKGSVKLLNGSVKRLLKPGQQAVVKEQISINNNIDVADVVAWKHNKFVFDNSSIQQIMRQLEQWYDIEVVYEGKPTTEAFVGSISRDVNLSQILSLLSETNAVHFEQRGKKVVVKR